MEIWKYTLNIGDQIVRIPSEPKILSVGQQDGKIRLWALVTPDNEEVDCRIRVFGTGHHISGNPGRFIGTVIIGIFVWHVFQATE